MNRKPTWVLLGLFVIALLVLWYFEKSSAMTANNTPLTPTSLPQLIAGWSSQSVMEIQIQTAGGDNIQLALQPDKSWQTNDKKNVSQVAVEQLLTALFKASVVSSLEQDPSPSETGLASPISIITLKDDNDTQITITIGNLTPIQSGYYVRINQETTIVAHQFDIENILSTASKESLLPITTP